MYKLFLLVVCFLTLLEEYAHAFKLFTTIDKVKNSPIIGQEYEIKESFIAFHFSDSTAKEKGLGPSIYPFSDFLNTFHSFFDENGIIDFLPAGSKFTVKEVYRQNNSTFQASFTGSGHFIFVLEHEGKDYKHSFDIDYLEDENKCERKKQCKKLDDMVRRCQKQGSCQIYIPADIRYEKNDSKIATSITNDLLSSFKSRSIQAAKTNYGKGISAKLTALELTEIIVSHYRLNIDIDRIAFDTTDYTSKIYPKNIYVKD